MQSLMSTRARFPKPSPDLSVEEASPKAMPGEAAGRLVQIQGVTKDFGAGVATFRALDDVSLTIQTNEFFTLLGPSGCGKTTLLRLLAGFEHPTAGVILLDGKHVADDPPNRRPVNTVFQSYALFPHMSVAQNVAFGLERQGLRGAAVTERVAAMLKLVRLDHIAERRPQQLSGGQQQRVALARALAPQPRLLLLDEPLSALDLKLRRGMQVELKRIQRETGITFVLVTHDQEEALSMSDRIAVMDARPCAADSGGRTTSTSGRTAGSWPISSAKRTSCAGTSCRASPHRYAAIRPERVLSCANTGRTALEPDPALPAEVRRGDLSSAPRRPAWSSLRTATILKVGTQ